MSDFERTIWAFVVVVALRSAYLVGKVRGYRELAAETDARLDRLESVLKQEIDHDR